MIECLTGVVVLAIVAWLFCRRCWRRRLVLSILASGPMRTTQVVFKMMLSHGVGLKTTVSLLRQLEREGLVTARRNPDLQGERPELPRYIWSLKESAGFRQGHPEQPSAPELTKSEASPGRPRST